MAKRKRDMQLNFRVSAEELAVIEQKMSQFGTSNREAYLRKMAGLTVMVMSISFTRSQNCRNCCECRIQQ